MILLLVAALLLLFLLVLFSCCRCYYRTKAYSFWPYVQTSTMTSGAQHLPARTFRCACSQRQTQYATSIIQVEEAHAQQNKFRGEFKKAKLKTRNAMKRTRKQQRTKGETRLESFNPSWQSGDVATDSQKSSACWHEGTQSNKHKQTWYCCSLKSVGDRLWNRWRTHSCYEYQ